MVANIECHPFSKSLDPPLHAYAMETENMLQLELIEYSVIFFQVSLPWNILGINTKQKKKTT